MDLIKLIKIDQFETDKFMINLYLIMVNLDLLVMKTRLL
jgi:hypothetical protein